MAKEGAPKRESRGGPPVSNVTKQGLTKARAKSLRKASNDTDVRRGRKAIRHLKIAAALSAAPAGLTAKELMDLVEDGCDLRTIYRDLDQLGQAGFGIEPDGHRYRLLEGAARWRLPVETEELLALLLAQEVLVPVLGTEIGQPLVTLRRKLLAALSPAQRAYCEDVARLSTASHVGRADIRGLEGLVASIQEALVKEQVLRITYEEPNQPVEARDVEPYATWYVGGRLYLVARCRRAQSLRTFAVPRIQEVQILDDLFEVDPNFSLEEFVGRGFGVYHGSIHRVSIELGCEVAHLARERIYHRSQQREDLPGGAVRLTFEAAGLPEIASWVAGFGGKARVLEPHELVESVQAIHRSGLEVYDRHEPNVESNTSLSTGNLSSDGKGAE